MSDRKRKSSIDIDNEELNIEKKLKNIMYQHKFCGLCFEGDGDLCSIASNMDIVLNGKMCRIPFIEMVHDLFPGVSDTPAWPYLCEQCKEQIIHSYIFIQNTKATAAIINTYLNDFNSKVVHLKTQLDPSSNYDNSNVIIVLETSKELIGRPIETMVHNTINNQTIEKSKVIPGLLISGDTNGNTVAKIESMPIKVNVTKIQPQNNEAKGKIEIKPKKKLKINFPITKSEKKPGSKEYECIKCKLRLPTIKLWKEHDMKFHKDPILKCRFCSKVYDTIGNLNAHYKIHSAVKCKVCHNIMEDTHLAEHQKLCHRQTM